VIRRLTLHSALVLTFVSTFALALVLAPANALASTVLSFESESAEVACDDEVWIDIVADAGAVDLRGHSLSFTFDSTRLTVVDFAAGTLFDDANCDAFVYGIVTSPGSAQIDVAGLGCSIDGAGSIARVRVRGDADGIAVFEGTSSILRTSTNASIAATWTDGSVRVFCPIPTDATSWGTVKALYR